MITGSWISLAIEALVCVLLAVTIAYCVMLNSRLRRLKADELGMRKTITELVMVTETAERSIVGLKQAALDCDKTLAKRVREAEFFSAEIEREIGEGRDLLDRISQITRAAKAPAAQAGGHSIGRHPTIAEQVERPRAASAASMEAAVESAVLPRSQELRLQALQSSERLANLRRAAAGRAA